MVVKCVKVAVHSENIFKRRLDGLLQCTTAALGDCLVYYELRGGISRCLDLRDCARGDSMGIRSTLFLTGARRGTHAGLGVCRRMKWASSHGEQEEESSQVSSNGLKNDTNTPCNGRAMLYHLLYFVLVPYTMLSQSE